MSLGTVIALAVAGYGAFRMIGGGNSEPVDLDKTFTALPVPKDPAIAIWSDKTYMAGLRWVESKGAVEPDVAVTAKPIKNGGPLKITDVLFVKDGFAGPKPKVGDTFSATPTALVEIPDSGGSGS